MIKLIASDIDGTLLKNHGQVIPPRTAELIRALIDKGVYFTAASGRQYGSLVRMFQPVSDHICYVAENGCVCAYQDNIIARYHLPQDAAFDIIDAIHDFPDCYAMVSGLHTSYIDTDDPEFYRIIREDLRYNVTKVKDFKSEIKEPILKIAACDLNGTDRIGPHFTNMFNGDIKAVTAGLLWVDFGSVSSNKGVGLKALLDHLHIDPADCVAFGDQYNDVEMLKLAGTSYVMSTCAPGMEQHADHVTDSVEAVLEEILASLEA